MNELHEIAPFLFFLTGIAIGVMSAIVFCTNPGRLERRHFLDGLVSCIFFSLVLHPVWLVIMSNVVMTFSGFFITMFTSLGLFLLLSFLRKLFDKIFT